MSQDPTNPPKEAIAKLNEGFGQQAPGQFETPISTAAELCLYLIMILPDEHARIARVKDFCRLYDITEKRPIDTSNLPGQSNSPTEGEHLGIGRIFPRK